GTLTCTHGVIQSSWTNGRCLKCQRTFRVYPSGVSTAQQSATLKGLSVLLYVLGLSYQGVSDLLEALNQTLCKSSVYNNVQAAGERATQLRQQWLSHTQPTVEVLGIDFTHVKRLGQDTIVAVATSILSGAPLDFDIIDDESAETVTTWIRELADRVGAEVLVSDDADALKTVADELGLDHQLCRAHVNRNVHDLIASLGSKALAHPDPVRRGLHLSVAQFLADLQQVEEIIKGLPHDGQQQLAGLTERYQCAPPPKPHAKASMWNRMRLLTLNWSQHWSRLIRFQSWRGTHAEKLDGTNNVTEQVIGQRVKERYRTMRGYKRDDSILNVSSLLGWIGMQPPATTWPNSCNAQFRFRKVFGSSTFTNL
ncbi:MAG: transposase, partial [Chloroflexi bacterium]|nr:transposase [Chloroflexota bacterium]